LLLILSHSSLTKNVAFEKLLKKLFICARQDIRSPFRKGENCNTQRHTHTHTLSLSLTLSRALSRSRSLSLFDRDSEHVECTYAYIHPLTYLPELAARRTSHTALTCAPRKTPYSTHSLHIHSLTRHTTQIHTRHKQHGYCIHNLVQRRYVQGTHTSQVRRNSSRPTSASSKMVRSNGNLCDVAPQSLLRG